MLKRILIVALLACTPIAPAAAAEGDTARQLLERIETLDLDQLEGTYLVLVNANNRYSAEGAEMMALVRRLYLGELDAWPGGGKSVLYRRARDSPAQQAFDRLILAMNEAELAAHWPRLKDSLGRDPPGRIANTRDLFSAISRDIGACGFVTEDEAEKLPAKVRTLFRFSVREKPGGGLVSLERLLWQALRDSQDTALLDAFLREFPEGAFADQARTRREILTGTGTTETALVPPLRSRDEVEAYLKNNERHMERQLSTYNKAHRLLVTEGADTTRASAIYSMVVSDVSGDRVGLEISFQVGQDVVNLRHGTFLFEARWVEGELEIVGHRQGPATPSDAPLYARQEVEAYLAKNTRRMKRELAAYNREHRLIVGGHGEPNVDAIYSMDVKTLSGSSVLVEISFNGGSDWNPKVGTFLFEAKWVDGDLEIVGHGTEPAEPSDAPLYAQAEVEAYLASNDRWMKQQLASYNREHRIVIEGSGNLEPIHGIYAMKVKALSGESVLLEVSFGVGSTYYPKVGTFLFEAKWRGGNLELVRHGEVSPAG